MKSHHKSKVAYPLGQKLPGRLRSKSGMRYEEIGLNSLRRRGVNSDDLSISADTLRLQAQVATRAGYRQLASNFTRAAELVEIPNRRLLEIYEALRPNHSTKGELLAISNELHRVYRASVTARFIREAAEAYESSGLLRTSGRSQQVRR